MEIRGHKEVRAAAKDFTRFSSDVVGDRDVRDYQQLPLELDPPRHTLFREAVQPIFMSSAIEPKVPQFRALARDLIGRINANGGGEICGEFALPYVIGCLTIIFDRPQDYDEWLSWGPDVWTADAWASGQVTAASKRAHRERRFDQPTQRSGNTLHAYLTRVFDDAERAPVEDPERQDIWDRIAQLVVDGRQLSRPEMFGIGSVLMAGGRDTVIKLATGLVWHLIRSSDDRRYLAGNAAAFNRTVAELARFLSPLPKMERVVQASGDQQRNVVLSFVSANHDATVWERPERIDIHRERKPHLAFGAGRHSCLGMNITELEMHALLEVLVGEWPEWEFDGEPDIDWAREGAGADTITVLERFNAIPVIRR
ncbi:cytochrome P450 [Kribbella pittospori]|uniref:cytochrome P450 n=1 Tax=Kribbella pittospori TaxID=722689 RepID=UPI0013F444A4|nr:cytochrome P450 [Kribbella pittospori]